MWMFIREFQILNLVTFFAMDKSLILLIYALSVNLSPFDILQTEAKCMIVVNGQETTDCSDHVVDGIEAASTGSYPTVDVKYTVKICNYNEANAIALKKASGFQFYHPKVNENEETNIAMETLDNIIQPGQCIVKSGIQPISTSRASYYIKVFLEGPQQDVSTGAKIDNSYCYAYAFHVVDFKYDYGFETDPWCKTSVSLHLTCYLSYLSFVDTFLTLHYIIIIIAIKRPVWIARLLTRMGHKLKRHAKIVSEI